MWNKIAAFIEQHKLLSSEGLHLVALSGGADSVALLLIMLRLGYRVEAVHCNFHLRGDESDRDEQFVQNLCKERDVPIHLIHFDTEEYASLHQVSIEMAARELRYRYFEQLRQDVGADTICVAHHRDDSVETVLLNMLRGTGLDGLCGIRPIHDYVVRPLLCVGREEIVKYLESIGQDYVTDSTNLEDEVLRNKIRLNVLPMLRTLNPAVDRHISEMSEWLQEVRMVYDASVGDSISHLLNNGKVSIASLLETPSPEAVLFEMMRRYGFSGTQVKEVYRCLNKSDGTIWKSDSHELLINRNFVVIEPLQEPLPTLVVPEQGTYCYHDDIRFRMELVDDVQVSKVPQVATLDAATVPFPLTIRPVQAGDRFFPYGMKGSRLLSNYLTDLHLSRFDRRRQIVVTDVHGRIVWVVGRRIDNRCQVTAQTRQVLRIVLVS